MDGTASTVGERLGTILTLLHGHSGPQGVCRFAPLRSWCRTAPPPPDDGPANPETVLQEQIAKHLVASPGQYIYPPSITGQYDLCLRSQLMLPPEHTVFLLIPTVPLAQTDPRNTHTTPLHRLVANIQLPSQAYVGFVSLPEAILHANHTMRYPASVRAVRRDPASTRFLDLSTVMGCSSHSIVDNSSTCRYAVSLGLVIYCPYGPMGTSQFLPPPGELSDEDTPTPTPGWLPPDDPAPDSPAQGAHNTAREWANSMLMTEHLVAYASRWMLAFHDSFLNKSAAISALTRTRQDVLFLAHRTRTTHRPRFARRRPPYGAAFASAARALRYAI